MRRLTFVVLGMVLMGLLASLAGPASAQNATPVASQAAMGMVDTTPIDGMITFTVVERAETDTVIDQMPAGDSAGDLLVFANPVFDEDDQQQVGTDQGWCIRTDVAAGAWECTWTLILPQGQIVVQGPFLDNGGSTLAVTGGTGDFSSATGAMELNAVSATAFAFSYLIYVES